jgi:2-polyprenyl-3-methyl-5-hydroxy-6-metoxy-1,4-benzoquinol methylase
MVPDRLICNEVSHLPVGSALDLGCGIGTNSLYLARLGWRVTGVDWSEEAVFLAERAAFSAKVSARFEIADAASWNGNGTFDLVISTFALPAGGHAAGVIRNSQRLLAPGGTLLITEWDRSMADIWHSSPGELHDAAAIVSMLPRLLVKTAEVRRIPDMLDHSDPRASHGRWANVTVVIARRPLSE